MLGKLIWGYVLYIYKKKLLLQFEHFVFALKWPKDAFCKMLLSPLALNLMITVINCRTGIGLTKKGANFQKKMK